MSKFLERSLKQAKKLADFYEQADAYTGTNVKNVQVRVRLYNDNPHGPTELVLNPEHGSAEETAILKSLESMMASQRTRNDAALEELGFEYKDRGIQIKTTKKTAKGATS